MKSMKFKIILIYVIYLYSKQFAYHQFCSSIKSKNPKIRFSLIVPPTMPPKSHSISKRSSKHLVNPSTRKKPAETPKRSIKRAKNDKFVNPDSIIAIPSLSSPPVNDDASDDVLDISQEEFIIARCFP